MTVLFQFFSVMKVTFGIPQRKNHVLWLVKLGSPTAGATWTDENEYKLFLLPIATLLLLI